MGMTIAAIAALGPFLLAQRVAQAFSIASRWYFIAAGALAGSLLSPFAVYVITNGKNSCRPRFSDWPPARSFQAGQSGDSSIG